MASILRCPRQVGFTLDTGHHYDKFAPNRRCNLRGSPFQSAGLLPPPRSVVVFERLGLALLFFALLPLT
jgi:hypothetical protein